MEYRKKDPVMIAWRNFLFIESEYLVKEMKTYIEIIHDAKGDMLYDLLKSDTPLSDEKSKAQFYSLKKEVKIPLYYIGEILRGDFSEYWEKYVDAQPVSQEILDEILEDIEINTYESATYQMINRYEDIAAIAEKVWERMIAEYEDISYDSLKKNMYKALMDINDDKSLKLHQSLEQLKSI